jgi:serine/threonine protein phosphatase 1
MSFYVMSDIHGMYDKYTAMLRKIRLSESDMLFVLGDVLDRGSEGVRILWDMMMSPNIIPLLGNHDYMAAQSLRLLMQEVTPESLKAFDKEIMTGLTEWAQTGGLATIEEFKKLSDEKRESILEYLDEFELFDEVEAGGRDFVLVHAGLDNFSPDRPLEDYGLHEVLFHSPDYSKVYFPDRYLVTGHRPTRLEFEKADFWNADPNVSYKDEIVFINNHIAIDCGCGYGGRLGALCLDTMKTYYV